MVGVGFLITVPRPGPFTMTDITHERGEVYGPPEENHTRTARLWNAYIEGLSGPIDAVDVCFLNMLQKIARAQHRVWHADHTEDIIGYARNAEVVWRIIRDGTTDTE